MGSDIEFVFQKKTENGWEDVDSSYRGKRNYTLFNWLTRQEQMSDDFDPISEAKGLPDGFFRKSFEGDHSYSWLTLDEILEAKIPDIRNKQYISSGVLKDYYGLYVFLDDIRLLKMMHGECRMVFGFTY